MSEADGALVPMNATFKELHLEEQLARY